MTPETRLLSVKLDSVRAACERASAGPKKDAAWKHYRLAEKAHSDENHTEMYRELEAAKQVLA
ncbi:hypothetical protein PNH50_15540 [Leisingera aquaemixtae]|jgi:hypothetical protein|uniref:Uncharacterized protein n=1 Tax=Leisingera aquaemixtae TaxID=1396826 RepID=A0ABY5WHT7_9RHOB|nr:MULTISPECIES: hypothetical protein [Leisingera]QDI77943.1 hypothetical protein R2C4_20090 [Leisingera aquaemixtae]UWQ24347.1 hypothetical protein K3553_15535 [Leisingera aquaemixtae]UWQ36887.1 hypothetical protein K3552_15620 [Leisingera aquaemixtae]UWQ40984.1 hypothetical protein K3718_15810 [Leisingera aquaemixtae]UWQ45253.1 hypothetical protein K3719_15985 [Leisingera aquaemixtae]